MVTTKSTLPKASAWTPRLPRIPRLARRAAWAAVLLAALAAVAFGVVRARRLPVEAPFETRRADRGLVEAKVTATGTLSALLTVQVGRQVSGRVSELAADFNTEVKKGQVLARLDASLYDAALEQARASVVAAGSNVARAQVQRVDAATALERAEQLLAAQAIPRVQRDAARVTLDVAQAAELAAQGALVQARAARRQASVNRAYTTITSPIDGVVVSRNVDVGQTVAAAFQSPTLFVLAEDLRKMQVDVNVAEADVGRLRPGMTASFRVDAWPGRLFAGTIRQIRFAPQLLQNVVTYDAVLDVANADLALRPGMTANVVFVVDREPDAVRVPNAALRFSPDPAALARFDVQPPAGDADPTKRSLWLLRDGRPVAVAVTPGITDGSFTALVGADVQPGDEVIVDAQAVAERRFFHPM